MPSIKVPVYNSESETNKIRGIAEIEVYGNNIVSEKVCVKITMSKDALLGFGSYAIRLATQTDVNDKFHWQVDPLGNPCGNQPLGFFLTTNSPSFVLMYNQALKETTNLNDLSKDANERNNFRFNYEIQSQVDDDVYEAFEIGFQNLVNIEIMDENNKDVTKQCVSIVLKINQKELMQYGINMIKIAHNFQKGRSYLISHENCKKIQYDLGFILSHESSQLIIECDNCGDVFMYEPEFGK